jgi:hypothetical protein
LYPITSTVYRKIQLTSSSNSLTIPLAQALQPNKNTTVVLAYTTTGYVKHQRGVDVFDFQTLKSDRRTKDITVAVTVDDDYYLADAKGKVNYQPVAATELNSKLNVASDSAAAQRYVGDIGTTGQLVKHASDLAAGETYHVTGKYASNRWLLSWHKWAIGIGIFLIFLAIGIWRYKVRVRRPKTPPEPADAQATVTTAPARKYQMNVNALPGYGVYARGKNYLVERRLRPLFFGWLCAILALASIFLIMWASWYALYGNEVYYYGGTTSTPLTVATYTAAISASTLLFFVFTIGLPFLYMYRFGGLKAVLKIIGHVIVFFLLVGLLAGIWMLQNKPNDTYPPGCDVPSYSVECPVPL